MCSIPRPLRDGGGEPKFTKHLKLFSAQDDTEGRRHNHSLRMAILYTIVDSPNLLIVVGRSLAQPPGTESLIVMEFVPMIPSFWMI